MTQEKNDERGFQWYLKYRPRRSFWEKEPSYYKMEFFGFPIKREVPGALLADKRYEGPWAYMDEHALCVRGRFCDADAAPGLTEHRYEYGAIVDSDERRRIEAAVREFLPVYLEAREREKEDEMNFDVETVIF